MNKDRFVMFILGAIVACAVNIMQDMHEEEYSLIEAVQPIGD